MMKPRVVVLGPRGQVGYELVRTLIPAFEVVTLDRASAPLDDVDRLVAAVRAASPDLIVNAAAYTAVDKAESEPELARRINAEAPAALAGLGVRFVHYSTDYVFDGNGERPYREDDPVGPTSVYGETKLQGEQAVLAADPRNLVLRVAWVYGTRGKNFLLTMKRLGADGRSLRVVSDQIGAPTWSREIANATVEAIRRLGPEDPGGLYHLPAGGTASWYDFARAILGEEASIEPIPTSAYPTPAKRPAYSVLDGSVFRERFGFEMPDWRDSLARVLEE